MSASDRAHLQGRGTSIVCGGVAYRMPLRQAHASYCCSWGAGGPAVHKCSASARRATAPVLRHYHVEVQHVDEAMGADHAALSSKWMQYI